MTDRSERAILNHLIETCKDAERGFRHVADYANDQAVKTLFLDIASQRARFAEDLLPHAQRLGGAREAEGTTAGALHRTWIDLRSALSKDHLAAVINEAERGEHFSMDVYRSALESMLPPSARDVVEKQYQEIVATGLRLRALEHPVAAH